MKNLLILTITLSILSIVSCNKKSDDPIPQVTQQITLPAELTYLISQGVMQPASTASVYPTSFYVEDNIVKNQTIGVSIVNNFTVTSTDIGTFTATAPALNITNQYSFKIDKANMRFELKNGNTIVGIWILNK